MRLTVSEDGRLLAQLIRHGEVVDTFEEQAEMRRAGAASGLSFKQWRVQSLYLWFFIWGWGSETIGLWLDPAGDLLVARSRRDVPMLLLVPLAVEGGVSGPTTYRRHR